VFFETLIGIDGLFILALAIESNAFADPGIGILGIEPDSLFIGFDGFIVLALRI